MKTKIPLIAIIGRPNVGKSTLFNRIVETRKAIVDDLSGVTRDRLCADASFRGKAFQLMDTGGLEPTKNEGMLGLVKRQSELAIAEADAIIFLVDGRAGLTPTDREVMNVVRGAPKPVFVAVNKIDIPAKETLVADFFELGVDTLYPVSAEHGLGVDELLEAIYPLIIKHDEDFDGGDDGIPQIAIVGRPNVGKSTLINTIAREDRMVVSDLPGTTRDSIDTLVTYYKKSYRFIDTAGIRRRGSIDRGVEHYSVLRALKSLGRADVAILVLDSLEGPTEQDTKIAGLALRMGRAMILMINKWDLQAPGKEPRAEYRLNLHRQMPFLHWAPFLFGAGMKAKTVPQIFKLIDQVMEKYSQRVSTGRLNRFFQDLLEKTPPPAKKGKSATASFLTQVSIKPPTFVIFTGNPKAFGATYIRFLENRIREEWGFDGTPVRIRIKSQGKK